MDKFQRLQVGVLKIHNKSFPIYEGVNTVGRNKEAIVNIKHLNISQNHAVVVITNGSHFISDLNSSNGTVVDNHRVVPFKLYELKNNCDLKLGDLCGTYISQGLFTDNDERNIDMTQDVTQSFYGSNTQILDNVTIKNTDNDIEDIHEAPTQEISWSQFKIPRSIKPASKNVNHNSSTSCKNDIPLEASQDDIHNCKTQAIDPSDFQQNKLKKTENVSDQASVDINKKQDTNSKTDNLASQEENIYDAPTQVFPLVANSKTDNLASQEENIYDAPTQVFPLVAKDDKIRNPDLGDSELFAHFNDEHLPFLENDDNYVEIHQIPKIDKTSDIHEVETQVADITKNKLMAETDGCKSEDDEATDCEDNNDTQLTNINANLENSKKKDEQVSVNLNQDEVTDCEDNTQNDVKTSSNLRSKTGFLESDEGSNDSTDFFKLDRSVPKDSKEDVNSVNSALFENKNAAENDANRCSPNHSISQTENTPEENIQFKKKKICQFSSDSDTDDDNIGFKRKKKSAMILSTQDICKSTSNGGTSDNLKKRDSYIINDTDSETEIESVKRTSLEDSIAATQNQSIPATQNQSTTDLDDTDCIPATQDIPTKHSAIKSLVKSPKYNVDNNGSSEESFKLGLTELMMTPEVVGPPLSFQDPCCSKSLENPSPVFGQSSLKNNTITKESQDNTDKFDIKSETTKQNEKCLENNGENNEDITDNSNTLDIYLAPTQKVSSGLNGKQNNMEDTFNETECLYDAPTQKIELKANKSQLDSTNNEIYFAPTQKISTSPTPKIELKGNKGQLDSTNNEIYFAPTQKISTDIYSMNIDHNSSKEESMDDLYLQPTQELEDTFNQPTQKVQNPYCTNESNNKINNNFALPSDVANVPENTSLQGKKKFVFKKASCLDGSLSSILDHNNRISPISEERSVRSSIEFEFDGPINNLGETSKRPSNPLSHILENFSETENLNEPKRELSDVNIVKSPEIEDHNIEDTNIREGNSRSINTFNEENKNEAQEIEENINTAIKNIKKEKKSLSSLNKEDVEKCAPKKSSRTRESSTKNRNDELDNKTNIERLVSKDMEDEVKALVENAPDIKPIGRRTTRRPSASILDPMESASNKVAKKPRVNDSTLDKEDVEKCAPKKSSRIRESSTKNRNNESDNKTNIERLVSEHMKDEVKALVENAPDIKSVGRRTTRRPSASILDPIESVSNKVDNKPRLNDSELNEEDVETFALKKSSRTRESSTKNRNNESENKTNIWLVSEEMKDEVKALVENAPDIKPIGRRTTRRPSASILDSIEYVSNKVDKKPRVNNSTDNSLNATTSEVNQSIALLESKITKTRKTMRSEEIQVKVPKSRKSMTISEVDEASDQDKNMKQNEHSISTISKSTISTRKRGRTKKSEECETKIRKSVRNSKDVTAEQKSCESLPVEKKSTRLESVSENLSSDSTGDSSSNAPTNKAVESSSSKRQVGKRKQPAEVKSDTTDSSFQSIDSNTATPKKEMAQPSRLVRKRKQGTEEKSDNSDNSVQSVDSNLITPKKQKLQPSETILNTKERELRRQKPKVVFTMLDSPKLVSMIKQLGGSITDSLDTGTVLVTEHVKRSQKLLAAVGLGKPICSPSWITESKKAHEFLDPWDYILTDPEAEKKWNFSLKESLNRGRTNKLLNTYSFQIQVTAAADVLKGAIESCGGKCIPKIPAKPLENTFIISTNENQSKFKRIIKQHPEIKVIEPEAIFDGVLRQELRFSRHYLS